jgi:hypothetical protein
MGKRSGEKSKRKNKKIDSNAADTGAISPKFLKAELPAVNAQKLNGDTTKSSGQKPQLKIVRNNTGTMVFIVFGIIFDLVLTCSYFRH